MGLQQDRLRDALEAIRGIKIPEFPQEVIELDAEIQSKFANAQNITKIIERNTTLSGEVVKLANMPVMKAKNPVNTIRDAVTTMGFKNIYNLVVIAAFKRMFGSRGLHRDISDNSVDVAFCMAFLTEEVHGIPRDEAYLVGLFHNVGCLMLASKDEEVYQKIFRSGMSNPIGILQKEQEAFNTNHTLVGLLVAKKWQLPTDLLNVIMLHHTPDVSKINDDKVRTYVAMLKIANAIVAEISLGSYIGDEMKAFLKDGKQELMLDTDFINDLRQQLLTGGTK
ncbi:HDOD domain-containing protein [Thiomicrorhabdus indica]|uniref:HDOD domain-containing protein n=1 Tax=Thiomicrorhabdus indica TaxID=2267253 RepID=UPI00102D7E02|nr:HDOD domain-containing protein [Thiomicrorhabdus indica]